MALGGYKFVGYHFSLPADYDGTVDAQVIAQCLRLHKMKLKAFMESCAASGANWGFSETSGEESFESYGNVIYKLDADGFNYASFFRYGTEDAYYCMITLSNASTSTGSANQITNRYFYYTSNSAIQNSLITNNMSSIGTSPITPSNIFASRNDPAMYHRLAFFSDDSNDVPSGNQFIYKTVNERYFGFATKEKCIISLSSTNLSSTLFGRMSAFDALSLASPSDAVNMFSRVVIFAAVSASSTQSEPGFPSGVTLVTGSDGYPYENASKSNTYASTYPDLWIGYPKKSYTLATTTTVPYEAAVITAGFVRKNASYALNADGITTKGAVNIDLLAVNNIYQNSGISVKQTYANGNYLCVLRYTNLSNSYKESGAIYIGWDPSNPDITQESAWTAYTG